MIALPMNATDSLLPGRRALALVLLIAAATGGLCTPPLSAYRAGEIRQNEDELASLAGLKSLRVQAWLDEKRGDAAVLAKLTFVQEALLAPAGSARWAELRKQFELFLSAYDYHSVLLFDPDGHLHLAVGAATEGEIAAAVGELGDADFMTPGAVRIASLQLSPAGPDRPLLLQLRVPVHERAQPDRPLAGYLVFLMDSHKVTDLLMRVRRGRHASDEAGLLERRGAVVRVLNTSMFRPDAAVFLDAGAADLPAAQAARGAVGAVQGRDYRGEAVLAHIERIPDRDWFVIAKRDMREILAPVRTVARWSGAATALLFLAATAAWLARRRVLQVRFDLARQAAATEALAASERRLRGLVENTWDMIVLFDRGMRVSYASPAVEQKVGRNLLGESVAGSSASAHPEDLSRIEAARREALAHPGVPQRFEHRVRGRYDHWMTVEASFTSQLDDPDIGALVYVGRDISERKWSEQALRESEARYRFLFKLSPYAIFLHRDGVIFQANEAALRLFRTEKETALIGRHWRELIVAEDWPAAERRIAALEKGEQDYLTPVELRCRAFDGQTIEVEATAARVVIDGRSSIISIMRDITERKRMEQALRESEARLRALFDSAPVGIAIADTDGRYLMVNRAQCEMLGYGEAELLRRTFADVTHPDDVQANLDIAARLWQGEIGAGSVEKRYVRKDGSALWVLLTVSPVRTADGEVLGSVGVAQDITERREAEARRLEYAHRQRDILVREVHHRIKNHLQGLAGLLRQHLREQPALEPVVQKFAAQVRAIAIVHGLLGREKGDTSLRSLVDEIAAFLGQMAGSRIEPVCPEHACLLAVAEAEAVPVALVLNELLTNALRHGADPSRLRLSMQCDGNSASVVIRNPGRLSAAVDFAAGKGLGTGLGLIRSLLPPAGAALSLKNTEDGQVEARLELGPPLLLPAQLVSRR